MVLGSEAESVKICASLLATSATRPLPLECSSSPLVSWSPNSSRVDTAFLLFPTSRRRIWQEQPPKQTIWFIHLWYLPRSFSQPDDTDCFRNHASHCSPSSTAATTASSGAPIGTCLVQRSSRDITVFHRFLVAFVSVLIFALVPGVECHSARRRLAVLRLAVAWEALSSLDSQRCTAVQGQRFGHTYCLALGIGH
jgi:hypothetical protein